MEKMTKDQIKKRIEELNAELFALELTEEQMEKIESLQEPKKSNLNKLEKMLDDALRVIAEDGKKAVFKWSKINGYYKLKLSTVTPEKIQKNWKISFRLDASKIAKIDDYFYYNDKKKSDFSAITFENGQDICTVTEISENGEITAKSDKNGGIWYIIPEDINGNTDTRCVLKDGSNIAFLVYAPIENKE